MRRIYRRRYAGFSLKQGQGRGDGHQAFTSALAFFFYRTTFLPFSKHLPHPSLSLPPHIFSPSHTPHQSIPFSHSNPDNWLGPKFIYRIRIPGLLYFNTIQFILFFILLSFIISISILFYFYFHFHLLLEFR